MLTRRQQLELAAVNEVIAHRIGGAPAPVNPCRRDTLSHIRWDMARRKAEAALDNAQSSLRALTHIAGASPEIRLAVRPVEGSS